MFALVIFTIAIMAGVAFGWYLDALEWNHGRCPDCGQRWIRFDTDSQGGRGYKCPDRHAAIWVSYPVDKR